MADIYLMVFTSTRYLVQALDMCYDDVSLLDILDIIQIPENNRKSISKPYNVFLNNTRF